MRTLIAAQTYWFTADKSEVVKDGDERARWLCVRKGSPVDPTVAEMFGLEVENAPGETYPAPGANVPQGVTSAAHIEATRKVTREIATNRETATDASTSRQVANAIEGRVAGELGAPASAAAATVQAHERGSLSGSDLLTGTEAAKRGGGGDLGGAYEDRTGAEGRAEAGANRVPSETPAQGASPVSNSRTVETPAPQDSGASGLSPKSEDAGGGAETDANLKPGVQEYGGSAGVAITPPGTEREDKTKPPPPAGQLAGFGDGSALGTGGGPGFAPEQVGGGAPNTTVAGGAPPAAPTLAQARGEAETNADTLAGAKDKADDKTNPPQG